MNDDTKVLMNNINFLLKPNFYWANDANGMGFMDRWRISARKYSSFLLSPNTLLLFNFCGGILNLAIFYYTKWIRLIPFGFAVWCCPGKNIQMMLQWNGYDIFNNPEKYEWSLKQMRIITLKIHQREREFHVCKKLSHLRICICDTDTEPLYVIREGKAKT